jgi:hypothetical protein
MKLPREAQLFPCGHAGDSTANNYRIELRALSHLHDKEEEHDLSHNQQQ